MSIVVFDIETKNTFQEKGTNNPADLDISIVGVYDSETDAYTSYTEEEFKDMWPIFEHARTIVGFNSEHFDLPLLDKYYHGDLYQIKHVDILKEIHSQFGRRMKLDQLAEGTLGVKKSGHGLEAIKWWREGAIDKIRSYCIDDVKITKEIFDYAKANGILKFKEGGRVMDIKLNTKHWDKTEDAGMTASLPF